MTQAMPQAIGRPSTVRSGGRVLFRDVGANVLFAPIKLVAMLLLARMLDQNMRMLDKNLAPILLGQYLLAKRYTTSGSNLLNLGVSQTLGRFLPARMGDRDQRNAYFVTAVGVYAAVSVVAWIGLLAFQGALGRWLFPGSPEGLGELLKWIVLFSIVSLPYFILLNDALVLRRMVTYNLAALLYFAGWEIVTLRVLPHGAAPAELLKYTVLGCTAVVSPYLLIRFAQLRFTSLATLRKLVPAVARHFATYGLSRSATLFIEASLMLVGPFMLRNEPAQMGCLALALTLVRAMQMLVMPINQLTIVVAGRHQDNQNTAMLRRGTALLLGGALVSSAFFFAATVFWANDLYGVWLTNPDTVRGMSQFNVLLLAVVPFTVFLGLKGIVDVQSSLPLNAATMALSILVAFASKFIFGLFVDDAAAAAYANLLMFCVLAAVTCWWVRRLLPSWNYLGGTRLLVALVLVLQVNGVAQAVAVHGTTRLALAVASLSGSLGLAAWILLRGEAPPLFREVMTLWRNAH